MTSDLTIEKGQVLIGARVNGTAETFILDTGAAISALRDNVVETLGIPRAPIALNQISDIEGRSFSQAASVQSLKLGEIDLGGLQMIISPRPETPGLDDAGLIGADLLQRYDVDLDFPKRKATFFEAGHCLPDHVFDDEHESSLPFRPAPGGRLFVPVTLDGKDVEGLIDTGAAMSILTLDAFHRHFGLNRESDGVRFAGTVGGANRGQTGAYVYNFRQLSLSDIQLDNPAVALIADETRRVHRITEAGAQDSGLPDLILGMSELAKIHLYVSYADSKIYLSKP